MNIATIVNTARLTGMERSLAEKLLEELARIPWLKRITTGNIALSKTSGFDFKVVLHSSKNITADLWVQWKVEPRPSRFPYVAIPNQHPERKQRVWTPVFAAPHISPNMARICWDHHWSWFDLAGNCRISLPGLYIERSGQKPVHVRAEPKANLSTAAAARVVRVLLATKNAGRVWTQRDIQAHASPRVSIGLVNKIIRHLRNEALVEEHRQGGFSLRKPLELLAAWRSAYRFKRHQRHNYFTLLQGQYLRNALAPLTSITEGHIAFAAFSAADFQAPHVRQPKTWLFVAAEYEDVLSANVEAKRVDSGENLIVLIPDDIGVFYLPETHRNQLACTNAVQTYVDLFYCGSRGEEAAEALLDQTLKPAWKAHNLL